MLCFDKIDVSGSIDLNKTSKSKKCDVCPYWYFLDKGFKFQRYVSNKCHDLLIMSMNLNDIAILTILNMKDSDYRCIITRITKSEAINLM